MSCRRLPSARRREPARRRRRRSGDRHPRRRQPRRRRPRLLGLLVRLVVSSSSSHSIVVVVFVVVTVVVGRGLDIPADGAPCRDLRIGRRIVVRVPGPMAPEQDHDRRDDEAERHELGDRDPVEGPVVRPERLEEEADEPVPDEEDEQEVTGAKPLARVVPDPDEDDRPERARDRLVQEERVEPGRLRIEAARVGLDPMCAVDRDPPRQGRRRAVQLLVEEVPPAGDGLHHEQARRDDVRPAQERDSLVAGVQEGRDRPSDDPAVDPEARVGRQEDLDRVVLVEGPLVDDVIEPTADERRDGDHDHPVAQDVRVLARPTGQADHHEIGRQEARPRSRSRTSRPATDRSGWRSGPA